MATIGKPDLANYRTRLYQILPTIGITLPAGITAANVFKAPGLGQSSFPFWVLARPTVTSAKEAVRIYRMRIGIMAFLARDADTGTSKAEALADIIDGDVSTVLEYFQSRNALVSSTLTANQAGYLPGSFSVTANPDAAYPVKTGWLLGSAYTFELTHRVVYEMQYR